ncbi:MAG TPA: SbmA/BacA-like family transporter [Myxococcota bacterium]|jgi:putative ATP-binding cassette transporter|nr:SbmA/BacA-like family transporter [Myxococcota bacterium]
MTQNLGQFLRDVRALAAPYWSSEERWAARGLAAVVIALSLGRVGLLVALNRWYQEFYDALQQLDRSAFWRLIGYFAALATVYIAVAAYQLYLQRRASRARAPRPRPADARTAPFHGACVRSSSEKRA